MNSWEYRGFAALVLLGFLAQVHSRPPGINDPPLDGLLKRIVGGKESKPNKWPWQGLLLQLKGAGTTASYRPRCGAVLIDEQWVVTSAACVFNAEKSTLKVVLGEHSLIEHGGKEQEFYVSMIHIHRKAFTEKGDQAYDIALLKLDYPADITEDVQVATLPKQGEKVKRKKKCFMVGWGDTEYGGERSSVLQQVKMPVVSYKACKKNEEIASKLDEFTMFCAGFKSKRKPKSKPKKKPKKKPKRKQKSGCHGDAGGSFACKKGKKWVLQGIVSWGDYECGAEHGYSVMTKISSFIRWIEEKIISPPLEKTQYCIDTHYYCKQWKAEYRCEDAYFETMLKEYYCRKTCDACQQRQRHHHRHHRHHHHK